jgi:peptide deformylase
MQIIKFPDPILRERMPEVDFSNNTLDLESIEKEMTEIMLSNNGMGLSANQVGLRLRMFIMGSSVEDTQAFYNPEVIANTDTLYDDEEGCLSFPGIYVNIKRPRKIKARWQNRKGQYQEGEFSGYACKCFLHEFDHLEGIVFQDRVSQVKWMLAVKKSKKDQKKNARTK